jgi:predicted AAA+ superfamily ATPase
MSTSLSARVLDREIFGRLKPGREIIVLYGARQTGKTTLVEMVLSKFRGKILSVNANEIRYVDVFSSRDFEKMRLLVAGYDLLFIDEAQRIPDIGINLKILHDRMPELIIIVTGSSSFELANRVREPLTGRTATWKLYPLALMELAGKNPAFELDAQMENFLLFGSYPGVLNLTGAREKQQKLAELCAAYLYKDVLELSSIRHSNKLVSLLKLLALQVGSLVSVNELAQRLSLSKETVNTYIDLLEKSFVLLRLGGYNSNSRKEIGKMEKIYFCDLGIRNSLINNFNPLSERQDTGALWENFLLLERLKFNEYSGRICNTFFWRTYTGVELDFVEEAGGKITGFEFKWGTKTRKAPGTWQQSYPQAGYQMVNRENYLGFIGVGDAV